MTAQFHVDTTAHASSKVLPCEHAPSSPDRSYAELPATPPSPPHTTIQAEFWHLRQCTLLNWVNSLLGCTPPLSSFLSLLEGDRLCTLITRVSGQQQQPQNGQQGFSGVVSMLHAWLGRTQVELAVSTEAVERGNQDQLISLVSLILTQHQIQLLNALQDTMAALVGSHMDPLPVASADDVQRVVLSYIQAIMADYATWRPSVSSFSGSEWKSGVVFMALLHWHQPASVRDLVDYKNPDQSRWSVILDTAFQRAHNAFDIPILLDAASLADASQVDHESVLAYLVEFIAKAVPAVSHQKDSVMTQRQNDIEEWISHMDHDTSTTPHCATPEPSDQDDEQQYQHYETNNNNNTSTTGSFTITSTYTQVRLTKSTKSATPDEEFEARVSSLLDKIAQLQHRLASLVPTRSSAAGYAMHNNSPATPDTQVSLDENSTIGSSSTNDTSERRRLHPLDAGPEDLEAYQQHFAAFQATLQAFEQDDMDPFRKACQEFDEKPANAAMVEDSYSSLMTNVENTSHMLDAFRRGFEFTQRCKIVRGELDAVQALMVRMTASSTDENVQDMERRVEKAAAMIRVIPEAFQDLITTDGTNQDSPYQKHYDALVERSGLVRSWVAEVRVWFAEAGRIRRWISIRMNRLDETTVPEPLKDEQLATSRETIEALNKAHASLEAEIEGFNKEDMARLRAHVKARTGASLSSKDLSPADTTTIEITLTTLAALDRLLGTLRAKGDALQILTQRMVWEDHVTECNTWITDTDNEVAEFIQDTARWQPTEDDQDEDECVDENKDDEGHWRREQLLAKERLKELVIQRLLMLENSRTEFDQGQFTLAVDAFQDLEDLTAVPAHLEKRQTACEERAETLGERIAYARQVVEQRLTVMDFVQQAGRVTQEGRQLLTALAEAQTTVHPDDSDYDDHDMTARVQTMQERIVQLVTAAAARIPYPESQDDEGSPEANAAIREAISAKRTALILLGDELDQALAALRTVLQMHRRGRQLLNDASRLSTWAEDRLRHLQSSVATESIGMDGLCRLERERDNLQHKLRDKENDTVDVLTSIHSLLDTTPAPGGRDRLDEAAQHLTCTFDDLRDTLDAHSRRLDALRRKLEDDTTYSEQLAQLAAFVARTRAALPGLKQTHGFITGQSEDQDRQRHEALDAAYADMETIFKENGAQFNRLRRHQDVTQQPESVKKTLATLDKEWEQLADELQHFQRFTEAVGGWCGRQRRLSMAEKELLNGLHENVSQLARTGWNEDDLLAIERRIDEALRVLDGVGNEIAAVSGSRDDPLEMANYACARDRHSMLTSKAHAIRTSVDALRKNADHAVALSEFLGQADALVADVQAHMDMMRRRMSLAGHGDFASLSPQAIEQQYLAIQRDTAVSENRAQQLRQQLQQLQRGAAAAGDNDSVREALKRAETAVGKLLETVALEKRQAAFVRKTQIHAKAAGDLKSWMDRCNDAVRQLTGDVCIKDESELRAEIEAIEHKMVEMQPVVRAFQAMPSRIFAGRDGQPIDLSDMHIDGRTVRSAIQTRENNILDEWRQLGEQLNVAKQRVKSAARHGETARKVKEILSLAGRLRERTEAIRIINRSNIPNNDDDHDNELSAVTTCPLSLLPTEHELLGARAELDAIERDIEHHLHARLAELDAMLNSNAESEDIFAGQRTEIAAALRGLTDMVRDKRAAASAAARLEPFLVVVEELEVLLSAIGEVVDRASPSYARTTEDGKPSRADLQGMLIDLDTRYRYYEPKIDELLAEARREATPLAADDHRVSQCVGDLADRWAQLQALAAARRSDLVARVGPLGLADFTTPPRRTASLAKRQSMPAFPKPSQSTPRPTGARAPRARPQSAMSSHRPRPASVRVPMSRRTAATAAVRTTPTSATARPPSRGSTNTPETYVPDPANDLDMAVGNIVNDSPYKIRVKMVPGEVGRYWFGTRRPKLAYCRILRSRMVMVRVGGGWVELSQFLRDQKLLEESDLVPHRASSQQQQQQSNARIREGVVTIRGGGTTGNKRNSFGPTSPSPGSDTRSTPHPRGLSPTTFGHGVKEGNKFLIPVDGQGNQVEVRMTKAKYKNSGFITPWR